jgi:transcription-repair coupling factor (superfamily II helicase)
VQVARLTQRCRAAGVRRLDVGASSSYLVFEEQNQIDPAAIIRLIQREPRIYRLEGALKLRIGYGAEGPERAGLALAMLAQLAPLRAAAKAPA